MASHVYLRAPGPTDAHSLEAMNSGGDHMFRMEVLPARYGDCVWIEIFNNTTFTPDCLWLWSTAPGDGVAYQFNDIDRKSVV